MFSGKSVQFDANATFPGFTGGGGEGGSPARGRRQQLYHTAAPLPAETVDAPALTLVISSHTCWIQILQHATVEQHQKMASSCLYL